MFTKFGTQWMVAHMDNRKVKLRKDLNADALFSSVRSGFEAIVDTRSDDVEIPLADAIMSAFAMFSLKDPSLLAFEERRSVDTNLKTVYKIGTVPCDTQMRTILDGVDPDCIGPIFKHVFGQRKRGQGFRKNGLYERVLSAFCRWHRIFLFKYSPLRSLFYKNKLKNGENYVLSSDAMCRDRSPGFQGGDTVGARANHQTGW